MAKIIKVASSTSTPRITNQFKTSRVSTTNPFKYQNFEGNTLDVSAFADVFATTATKETSRIKLIASSVAGCMHRIRTGITEPIINFVNRVRESVGSAWDYAMNTNISDLPAFKGMSESLQNLGDRITSIEIPGSKAAGNMIGGMKSGAGAISDSILGLGKGITEKWDLLISKFQSGSKISAETPVAELEALWKAEIESSGVKEVA